MTTNWKPEIYYEDYSYGEENSSITSGLPFINVPNDHNMPSVLFICEARDISEEENDLEKEIIVHSYYNSLELKDKLDSVTYDKVRMALGLKPLTEAQELGVSINKSINENINKQKEE
tara:strand:- start:29 stop:382 length:354 start_codon:yes stop_codon:yes gene_type:complete